MTPAALYLLMADMLAGIVRALDRAYHDPRNRDPEMTAQLEKCITLVEELQREIAWLQRLSGQQRRKRQGVRASMN